MLRRSPPRLLDVVGRRVLQEPRDPVEPQPARRVHVREPDAVPRAERPSAARDGHEVVHAPRLECWCGQRLRRPLRDRADRDLGARPRAERRGRAVLARRRRARSRTASSPSTRHANEQLGIVVSGSVTFRVGDEERAARAGRHVADPAERPARGARGSERRRRRGRLRPAAHGLAVARALRAALGALALIRRWRSSSSCDAPGRSGIPRCRSRSSPAGPSTRTSWMGS